MSRSDYLSLINHSQICFECRDYLLQNDGDEALCREGRRILSRYSLVLCKHSRPHVRVLESESESEWVRRTR